MKCSICGYTIDHMGCLGRTCRYEKATGRFNAGKRSHTDCAMKHWDAHHHWNNPKSLVSIARRADSAAINEQWQHDRQAWGLVEDD